MGSYLCAFLFLVLPIYNSSILEGWLHDNYDDENDKDNDNDYDMYDDGNDDDDRPLEIWVPCDLSDRWPQPQPQQPWQWEWQQQQLQWRQQLWQW